MIKSFVALSLTTGVRLLTGLVLFVLLAREWSAGQFGQFMYLFSIAALLLLACEFGFAQQILREIGRTPERARMLMSRYLGAKIWLTALTWVLAASFAWFSGLSWGDTAQLAGLLLAGLFMSYADFLMTCFRAMGYFGEEAGLTVVGNLLYFAFSLGALYFWDVAIGVAVAMAVARLIHLGLTYRVFKRRVPEPLTPDLKLRDSLQTIKASSAYGADVGISAAFINADTVLIAHSLGAESVGIYQAIARIYQGLVLMPAIMGSLFLPRLARTLDEPVAFDRNSRLFGWGLVISGLLASAFFALGEPLLAVVYDQPHLQESFTLLPWFALLVFVRFVASVYGVVLTALGKQRGRAVSYVVALLVMLGIAPPLLERFGVAGMVMACAVAYALLAVLFAAQTNRSGAKPQAWKTATLLSITLTAFCLWKAGVHV